MAQKVGVVETAAGFFKRRADGATGDGMLTFLENAPDLREEDGLGCPGGRFRGLEVRGEFDDGLS